MTYTKKEFGSKLKRQMASGYDILRIARWAYREFLDHSMDLETGLQTQMMKIIAMEEGPEFEMTAQEILDLASELEES